jgi:hypothetical protein
VIVAVPAVVEEVSVTVYVPLPRSDTSDNVPEVVDKVTTDPPVVRLFPLASLACTVIKEVLIPSATIEVGVALIVEVTALAVPGVKVTLAVVVTGVPFIVPVTVAVPAVVDEANVAVYVPSRLSVTEESVPNVDNKVTLAPPIVIAIPLLFFAFTVIIAVLIPFAGIEIGVAVIVELEGSTEVLMKFTSSLSVIAIAFNVPVTVAIPAATDDVNIAV